jgi:glycosyltransferase involved in cell wall biosynthesis
MIKVSVIVPTYCPGAGLDRVIASLDAQTMPQAELETVFVDDGSPDDTLERLHELARTRPNMRVTSIPNSGWPSRPRNVGLDLAAGEFVVFMDHDDHLYPRALEAAYDYAVAQGADVVSGKEVRSNQWFAYWAAFLRDIGASEPKRPQTLSPWTTHKLFRRSLLLEHGIRFPEGARVLWEDVMVDMEVYGATDRIAVLASEPFYLWVHTPGTNASSAYGHDVDRYSRAVEQLFDRIEGSRADDEFKAFMSSYQYARRILSACAGPRILRLDAEAAGRTLTWAREFADRRVPVATDQRQSAVNRARAALLRAGRWSLLRSLAELDREVRAVARVTNVEWTAGHELVLDVEATWCRGDAGEPLLLRRVGDRLLRVLPDELAGALPDGALDVTDDVARLEAGLTVTSRTDGVGWAVPLSVEAVLRPAADGADGTSGLVTVGFRAHAVLDPGSAAMGRRLAPGSWVLSLRAGLLGHVWHQPLRHPGAPVLGASGGEPAVVGPREPGGRMELHLGLAGCPVMALTRPRARQAAVTRHGLRGRVLRVPVDGVEAVIAAADRPLEVRLRPLGDGADDRPLRLPGALARTADGGALQCALPRLPAGRYRVLVRDPAAGETWSTRLVLVAGRRRVSVSVLPVRGRRRPVWGGRP